MPFYASVSPFLATSARERRGQTTVRILLALLLAWMLWTADQASLILPWLAVSLVVQVFEWWALRPFRSGPALAQYSHRHMLPAIACVILMAGVHAGLTAYLWTHGGNILTTMAVLILAGGLLNNVASGIESRPLFYLGASPYLAALASMPAIALLRGDDPRNQILITVGIALFYMAVLGVWSRVHRARMAEIAALAESQTRLEQAEAAMADRAAMAAIVSHELRTPVSAILAGAHVIRHGGRPEQTPRTADLIIDAGRLMTGMLNDLLDHSKMEARAMTVEARDFDLTAMISDTARFWAAPAAERGLTFDAPEPGAPLWVKGDPFRLRQILNNLMSNALKFTAEGRVALEVETQAQDDRMELRLIVRDQGPGIPPEAMDRLFAPFAQASSEVARTYGGTGLGLVVSRDLARLMGGELSAESRPNEGAAFILDLSLPQGAPVEEDNDYVAPAPALDRRLRVLAVDDHEINRRTLALVLQPLDVDLATAVDGASALKLLADQPFDVVLMDVNMPGIDGNETTRRLRASGGLNAALPVIGFSAGAEPAQVAACYEAGMTDWLPKPLEPRNLYLALERAVRPAPEPKPAPAKDDQAAA